MRRLVPVLLALALTPTFAAADVIKGTATYLQRMMLPPGSVVEIMMQDVSRADAPAKTLATYRIDNPGAPPYQFAFEYDPASIDERGSYSLRATVTNGDKLLMTTDTVYPVLTRGAGNEVEMVMKAVAQSGSEGSQKPNSDFVNTYWKVLTLQGQPVTVTENQKEPHLILRPDGSYNATAGCNMIAGGYEVEGAKVKFMPGPTTLMACVPPLDDYEAALIKVLGAAGSFGIDGESMELVDPAGGTLATFQAVYLQ